MDVKRKLFNRLREFHPEKDFVIGVMSDVQHPEDQQTVLDFIDNEKEVTVEDVILLSLHLCNQRKTQR